MHHLRLAAGFTLALSCSQATALAAVDDANQNASLAPHRAVYDISLLSASERSGISGMTGRMVYEFDGSSCKGYSTKFRFVTRIATDDDTKTTDQQTITFENPSTGDFAFQTKSFTGSQLDKEVKGEAHENADALTVKLSQPEKKSLELAASRFPTEHLMEVINQAKEGKTLVQSRLFDGTDDAAESLLTTTVIGKRIGDEADAKDVAGKNPVDERLLDTVPSWPVTIAYYKDSNSNDAMPVYRMSFRLFENGIVDDLAMDYGDFVLGGRLARLDGLKTNVTLCK
ncbi:cell envelope integrity EipB family protein [Rhizobium sp. PAMB 3174]